MTASRPTPRHALPRVGVGAVLLAVGLTATCLRSPVTAVGAELAALRGALGLGGLGAGVLTAMPLAVFAAAGLTTPAVARRLGARRVVLGGLVVIALGTVARAASGSAAALLAGTAVVLVAVAWINVVLPSLVGPRSSWATGIFSSGVLTGIAAPAALSVPIGTATGLGWRGGVGVWAVLSVAGLLAWLLAGRGEPVVPAVVPPSRAGAGTEGRRVALSIFFGAQSLGAFAVMGWLPQIYRDAGLAPTTSAVLLAVTVVPALPAAVLVPVGVARGHGAALVLGVGAAQVLGLIGLVCAPAGGAWGWAVLLTTAHWGFPLAMALIARQAAGNPTALSARVQGGGYALAVVGPLVLGPLHDESGSWALPLVLLVGAAIVQVAAGLRVTARARPSLPPAPLPLPAPSSPPSSSLLSPVTTPIPTGPGASTTPLLVPTAPRRSP